MGGYLNNIQNLYGTVPPGWTESKLQDLHLKVQLAIDTEAGQVVLPLSTYLLFAQSQLRIEIALILNAISSDKLIAKYVDEVKQMKERAQIQAQLDQKNFTSEVEAFGSLEQAVQNPHLDISAVYRYAAAVQQALICLVDDRLKLEAVLELRRNPFLYTAYGPDYVSLMPIQWEEL